MQSDCNDGNRCVQEGDRIPPLKSYMDSGLTLKREGCFRVSSVTVLVIIIYYTHHDVAG